MTHCRLGEEKKDDGRELFLLAGIIAMAKNPARRITSGTIETIVHRRTDSSFGLAVEYSIERHLPDKTLVKERVGIRCHDEAVYEAERPVDGPLDVKLYMPCAWVRRIRELSESIY